MRMVKTLSGNASSGSYRSAEGKAIGQGRSSGMAQSGEKQWESGRKQRVLERETDGDVAETQ